MINTPKYLDIVEWTKLQIKNEVFKPNDKFLSEAELGKKFNVYRQTVRRALEILENQGLITRVQGSGTYISGLREHHHVKTGKRSMIIGVISTYLDNYIFPSIVRGVESVLSKDGYAIQLSSTNNSVDMEFRSLQSMLERQVDGLIISPTRSALPCVNLDLYHTIIKSGIPIVFINSCYSELSVPFVALDDVKAGYLAAQHLLSKGHRNISGIFSHINRQGHLRYLGYAKALSEYGISVREEYIFWYSKENLNQILTGNPFMESLNTCTAAVCFNDHLALTLIDHLRQIGKKVPEDLSLVGIDNSELAKVVSLTSIVHPSEELGQAAANLLLSMINGADGKNILFPPHLQIRDSVKEVPDSTPG